MERLFEVKPIGVKYICDSCESGEMVPTGKMIMYDTYAKYTHVCNKCCMEKDLKEKYPLIRYQ